MKETPTTAFECGEVFRLKEIKKFRCGLEQSSLEFEPHDYLTALDGLELNQLKLRQLRRWEQMKYHE